MFSGLERSDKKEDNSRADVAAILFVSDIKI